MPFSQFSISDLAINAIRVLSIDAVQQANSGHPGTPMALAPVTYALWRNHLQYDPAHPLWPARERFVLSCGHASMLLYSTLHLANVQKTDAQGEPLGQPAISLDDIKNFRQLGSPCAGHPEHGCANGIETTTGPLGQGVGNSVGMAIAGNWLAARYNRPGFELFGFRVTALCSDGDVMEGVGCEAASVAGHLQLANLCWIYDDNRITIEGETDLAFSENVAQRFAGLGWRVLTVADANDLAQIESALADSRDDRRQPTLIILRSVIGYGSPNKAGSHEAHGAPLGEEEARLTKKAYGWPETPAFHVPGEVYSHFAEGLGARGQKQYSAWKAKFAEYAAKYPREAAELRAMWAGELPEGWDQEMKPFPADAKGAATRVSSGKVLNQIGKRVPWLMGGSADLAPSTRTLLEFDDAGHLSAEEQGGRNMHFGVREHVMGSICNGLALCGLRPYGATFFVFTDYMRPAMRLSSIMHLPVLYVLTHDSIGLGEDGPTHQPVEHLAACRAIPGLIVLRPADANEVREAYRVALAEKRHPVALVLTRQNTATLDRARYAPAAGLAQGAYVLCDPPDGAPRVILIGTGSELGLCVQAAEQLQARGVATRVVSMPSWELFERQSASYRQAVLPPNIDARIAVEAGVAQGWQRHLGPRGVFIGMSGFGASAPDKALYKHFGITVDKIVAAAKELAG